MVSQEVVEQAMHHPISNERLGCSWLLMHQTAVDASLEVNQVGRQERLNYYGKTPASSGAIQLSIAQVLAAMQPRRNQPRLVNFWPTRLRDRIMISTQSSPTYQCSQKVYVQVYQRLLKA